MERILYVSFILTLFSCQKETSENPALARHNEMEEKLSILYQQLDENKSSEPEAIEEVSIENKDFFSDLYIDFIEEPLNFEILEILSDHNFTIDEEIVLNETDSGIFLRRIYLVDFGTIQTFEKPSGEIFLEYLKIDSDASILKNQIDIGMNSKDLISILGTATYKVENRLYYNYLNFFGISYELKVTIQNDKIALIEWMSGGI